VTETPFENGHTPYGRLYEPQRGLVQFATLFFTFAGGPAVGIAAGAWLGNLSESAEVAICLPFVAIFFLGYALWAGRLHALAFDLVGRGILKALFCVFILRRKPAGMEDVLPSREKLVKAAVAAQRAGWSFLVAAVPVAGVAALGALIVDADAGAMERAAIVGGASLMWGYVLGWLARHGYMPIMESN
jgi:hypothetical protein